MSSGWTGGQYSLFRIALAIWIASVVAPSVPTDPLAAGATLGLCLLFGVGAFDRIAAAGLVVVMLFQAPMPIGWAFWLLVAHLFVPPGPYGSWSRRGAPDPGTGWTMPGVVSLAVQGLLAISWVGFALHGAPENFPRMSWVFLHVLAFDPAWIPAAHRRALDHVFYDGTCALCHMTVRFLLAEDREGRAFRFAALDSHCFGERVDARSLGGLPDSFLIQTSEGTLLWRSDGFIRITARLGGLWRVISWGVWLLPRPVRNALYDFVAATRHRFFGRKKESCPLLSAELRARFDV